MDPITRIVGTAVPLGRNSVDTDQIMPKQFLKRVERSGFGQFLFHDWRANGDFVLDDPRFAGASVLVAGRNFGCGSSREQAVWGLLDYGLGAVIAPSFAPIFRQNAARSRLLTVELSEEDCERCARELEKMPDTRVVIDIEKLRVAFGSRDLPFPLDQRTWDAFILGTDEIERTLVLEESLSAYERQRRPWLPRSIHVNGGARG